MFMIITLLLLTIVTGICIKKYQNARKISTRILLFFVTANLICILLCMITLLLIA